MLTDLYQLLCCLKYYAEGVLDSMVELDIIVHFIKWLLLANGYVGNNDDDGSKGKDTSMVAKKKKKKNRPC